MKNVPTIFEDEDDSATSGVIQGRLLKFNAGKWLVDSVELPPKTKLLAIKCFTVVQHWQGKKVVEEITVQPFPNLDELNALIPQSEWEERFGKLSPPWVKAVVIWFIEGQLTLEMFTFINSSSKFARRAFESLRRSIQNKALIDGHGWTAMVELGSELRRNSFGSETPAPVFKIVEWRQSRQAETPQLTAPAVKPDSPDLNDSIPF